MTYEEALKPLDSAVWEMSEAFAGFPDEDLWKRPHPNLLSFGELAAHVAYGESHWLYPELKSILIHEESRYYPYAIEQPLHLEITAAGLYNEVKRIHEAVKAHLLEKRPDLSAKLPVRDEWTWGYAIEYTAFHFAYHTGQMYSVRHLLGHETANN